MNIVLTDLEGVLVPEIWINVAERTGIEELRLTTRDISDYDVLMKKRLGILDDNNLKIQDIQDVISTIDPMEGAVEFLDWLRSETQVIVVSDTFDYFAGPLMKKLKMPTLFCNYLILEENGRVADYRLRQQDGKRHVTLAMKAINFKVVAMGDSYNDVTMLKEADAGILFRPPENVIEEFPQFPVTTQYSEIKAEIQKALERLNREA